MKIPLTATLTALAILGATAAAVFVERFRVGQQQERKRERQQVVTQLNEVAKTLDAANAQPFLYPRTIMSTTLPTTRPPR